MSWVRAETDAGSVAVDAAIGNVRELCFTMDQRQIHPLHTAHWVAESGIPAGTPPIERHLSGDFLCAPFGVSDVECAPPHGKSANSQWTVVRLDDGEIELSLNARVMGAKITKTLRLGVDAPVLYQTHRLDGGQGDITIAHHPMVHLAGSGTLSVSEKRAALTPDPPLEPGRNALACPARVEDMSAFPAKDSGEIDLTRLPIASESEDFVTLVEAEGSKLGWTAIIRDAEDDIIFILKEPRFLPVTMLWHSNGGRDYAPWNGLHTGVVGIEDACAAGPAGHRAALSPNPVSREGVPTALSLGKGIEVRHVIGAVARPRSWNNVSDIYMSGSELVLVEDQGAIIRLPFDADFFTEMS